MPVTYSFEKGSAQAASLLEQFDGWTGGSEALQHYMPWLVNQDPAFLTTHGSYASGTSYYGTIVHGCNAPSCSWTPYMTDITHSCSCSSATVTVTTTIVSNGNASVIASNSDGPLFGGVNATSFSDTYLDTSWLESNVGSTCEDPSHIWYWMREERLGKL